MKTLKFKRDSWHFYVASRGPLNVNNPTDFCAYVRAVIAGLAVGIIFTLTGLVVIFAVGDFLAWIAAMVYMLQHIEPRQAAAICVVILSVAALVAVVVGSAVLRAKYKEKKRNDMWNAKSNGTYKEPEPSFIAMAYRSFKEKTCFKVELS